MHGYMVYLIFAIQCIPVVIPRHCRILAKDFLIFLRQFQQRKQHRSSLHWKCANYRSTPGLYHGETDYERSNHRIALEYYDFVLYSYLW